MVGGGMTTAVTSVGIRTAADGGTGTYTTIDRTDPLDTTATAATIQDTVTIIRAIEGLRIGDTAGQWLDAIGGDDTITDTTDTTGITRRKSRLIKRPFSLAAVRF